MAFTIDDGFVTHDSAFSLTAFPIKEIRFVTVSNTGTSPTPWVVNLGLNGGSSLFSEGFVTQDEANEYWAETLDRIRREAK